MYRMLRVRRSAMVALLTLMATSTAALLCSAQVDPPPMPSKPTPPELSMEQLQLEILKKALHNLLDKGTTEGEEVDRLVAKIQQRHERIFEMNQRLAQRLQQEVVTWPESRRGSVLQRQEELREQANYIDQDQYEQQKKLNLQLQQLQQELARAHSQLEQAREQAAQAESGSVAPLTKIFATKFMEPEVAAENWMR